ncbi:hypothetical protein BTZ20_3759 [Rhodococcus sp. MTM3W5.2]|uniref:hypothetical protein n=1 Tax=Rhodococcus sp. MTM3W5.2 TaxID=1805827 RepID=UPI0009793D30|nr:hypothetical protein [Rhodococcus sp. MTM3W5.2]AQA25738.1 hypothetical protein BTZ20_3759 [Rhodococcus sp. MTM3W5.2]
MQLEVDLREAVATVELTGVDEFTSLAVTVLGDRDRERAAAALGAWGTVDGDHVWLDIGALEGQCAATPCAARAGCPGSWR